MNCLSQPGDLLPLAMVMLWDFQERKFLLQYHTAKDGQECHQEVRDLHNSLQRLVENIFASYTKKVFCDSSCGWLVFCYYRCKTKLAASLARFRVKESLRSVSSYLVDRSSQDKAAPSYMSASLCVGQYAQVQVCSA